jgi:septum site-determining protein MinD
MYDFVIIDCPAGIEQGFKNAIAGADEAIVVCTPEVSSVRDADRVIGIMASQGITHVSLIVNRIKPELVLGGDMLSVEDVEDILGQKAIGTVLVLRVSQMVKSMKVSSFRTERNTVAKLWE